jgi:hypothetical protein
MFSIIYSSTTWYHSSFITESKDDIVDSAQMPPSNTVGSTTAIDALLRYNFQQE